jgi:putative glutamine amidotransferase
VHVNSAHHQGVGRLGEGLRASGWYDDTEIVEAIELSADDHPFALGVLWHPEVEEDSKVIKSFVEAARSKVGA